MATTINHRKLSDRTQSGLNLFRLSLLILLAILPACGKKAATPAPVVAQEQPSSLMAQPVAGVASPADWCLGAILSTKRQRFYC